MALGAEPTDSLEEILVNAEKVKEDAQDAPLSVFVLPADIIAKQGIINIDDLASRVPNVQTILPYGPQDPQFSIRGVNGTDFFPPQTSPIGVSVDGVFKSVPALQAMQLYDVAEIEVLKGPQGTVQGRNATGGTVNIATNAPSFADSGGLTLGVGNFGRYEGKGFVNLPLAGDALATRLAFTYTNVDGYVHNTLPGAPFGGNLSGVHDYGVRLGTLWQPDDRLKLLLRLHAERSDPVNYGEYSAGICCGGIGIPPGSFNLYQTSSGLPIPQSFYPPTDYYRQELRYDQTAATDVHRRDIESKGISLEITAAASTWLELTSVSGYDAGKWDTDENDAGAPININEADLFSKVYSVQEELRAASSFGGPYDFIFGLLYGSESLFFRQNSSWTLYQPVIYVAPDGSTFNTCLATGFYGCTQYDSFSQTREDRAAFMSNFLKITDALKLTLGARYIDYAVAVRNYQEYLSYLDNTSNGRLVTVDNFPGPGATQPNQRLTNHKWIERVALDYRLSPDALLYASWSDGFRGSAFNAVAQGAATNGVRPEGLSSYEAGLKSEWLDRRLRVNLAGFTYVYRNPQFASIGANGLADETNISRSTGKGVETELLFKPADCLVLSASSGYVVATYGHGEIPNPLAGYDTPNQPATVDLYGRPVYATPRWSFSADLDWTALRGDDGTLDIYLDGNGVTKQYLNAAYSPASVEGPHTIWSGRMSYQPPDGAPTVSLWTENLFDRRYLTAIYDVGAILNYSYAQRNTPRTFGLSLSYSW